MFRRVMSICATHTIRSGNGNGKRFGKRAAPPVTTISPRLEALEDRTLPTTYTVLNLADGGAGSLRDAVAQANAHPGADTIQFAPRLHGTIALSNTAASGPLNITDDLTLQGPGGNVLMVSGSDVTQTITVQGGVRFSLSGLTLTHGNDAAAVQNGSASGGAIFADNGSTLAIQAVRFADNQSMGSGGALDLFGSATIQDCQFTDNRAPAGGGGAIEDFGPSLTLANCSFLDNQGSFGGAIDTESGTLAVTNSSFVGNLAPNNGGAISLGCPATLTNCTFVANVSDGVGEGGAITNFGNPLAITNCAFLNNLARSVDGGKAGRS
jgi:hypothetical protein